ncbi:hypothetical protein Q7P37_007818 [Cladosporium fusiforme]
MHRELSISIISGANTRKLGDSEDEKNTRKYTSFTESCFFSPWRENRVFRRSGQKTSRLPKSNRPAQIAKLPTFSATNEPGEPTDTASACLSFTLDHSPSRRLGLCRLSSLPLTTASSSTPKKRKLAPFASLSQSDPAEFDNATYEQHQRESSSPRQQSGAPSPVEGRASPSTKHRAGALPPHVLDEVASAGAAPAGQSPSGAFAEITIDSGSSVDMSGSENGLDNSVKADGDVERVEIQRAASPAKRSAGEMEGFGKSENKAEQQDSYEDVAMAGTSNDLYDQDTGANSTVTSAPGTMTTNTSATSFQSEDPPPYSARDDKDANDWKIAGGAPAPSLDEQVQEVMQLVQKQLQHGDRGNVVSARWFNRVLSRTSENQDSTNYPKAAREGEIGPVDNSDIVGPDAFKEPILHDINGHAYIPLKQGLTLDEDYTVLPDEAWGRILGWYGIASGQKQITRYAHDTAPEGANVSNVVYELDPPVFLVRKFPQPAGSNAEAKETSKSAATELRLRHERRQRGQMKPEDALMVVSSRQEKGQTFLARVKEFAGIPLGHKVQIWRVLKPTNIAVDEPDNTQTGVASPPVSRDTSPSLAQAERTKLIVDASDWQKMEIGKDIELIDMRDQTGNSNYNGSSTIETFSLFENQTLILEEQKRGPGGGEYSSDSKKKNFSLSKITGSKPGSTVTSRRTSPAPGSTVNTRSSRRRDGKTRGTVGLSNLGNTCYMNSALQCIRSVEELAIYFLQDKYKEEINASNVLGSGGIMAKKYAEVLQGIYGDNASSSFSPNNFKKTLSQQNPVFSGWGQQDSQEFLSYLVDSIHEDLNRIQKKPYLENPDSDDARVTDPEYIKELGDTYRQNHAKRNESVCMDLFSGFYKNTMECPTCDKVSVTFDPFASLTLQLPIESTVMHNFTFVPLNGTPMNHNLGLEKNLSIKDIKKIIASKHENVDASKLWMVEIYNHKIYKHFSDRTTVAEANIQANDYIFVYELADVPTNIPPPQRSSSYPGYSFGKKADEIPEMDSEMAEDFAVPVFHRKKNRFGNGWDVTMHPQYVTIKREEAQDYDSVLKKVLHTVAQLTSRPILTEADENERSTSPETEKAQINGDADTTQDDAARVSDHSVASEDGYVSVSVEQGNAQTNGNSDEANVKGAKIPTGFYESSYNVPAILREQLFTLNYARGHENMFCTGTTGFEEKSTRNMNARVKRNSRRGSMDSSTADDVSNATPSSPDSNADEEDESDEDEEVSVQTTTEDSPAPSGDAASEAGGDELPEDPLNGNSPAGRRRANGKENKFKGNKSRKIKEKRPSKKEKREMKKAKARAAALGSPQSHRSVNGNDAQEDETYYIKLGECIILDWYPEALDSIFSGDANDDDDVRGHFLSDDEGKNLPFVHDPETDAKRNRRELRKKHGITLEDCFMETGKREKLSEDNAWYCNRCKELRQATKTLEIWTCPDIVVVHLKRFGGTRSFRDKIDVLVDYPIEGLDLTEKIGQKEDGKEYIYDLFAVDNHFGGLGGGHYTACAKNFFDGQWYDYNDSMTSKLGDSPRKSAAAYLLFYRRRSEKPLGPQYLQDLVTDFRNPPQQNNSADEAYESDSGEGRLGDPSSTLRGSSSNSVGAGVGASKGLQQQAQNTHRESGNGLAGQQAGQNQKLTTRETNDDDEAIGMSDDDNEHGQLSLSNRQYGNIGNNPWDFGALDAQNNNADTGAEMLLDTLGGQPTNEDADSNVADGDFADQSYMRDTPGSSVDGWNDTNQSFTLGDDQPLMYHDPHTSDAHVDALHLEDTEDASMMDDDLPTVDITLPDNPHAKMD